MGSRGDAGAGQRATRSQHRLGAGALGGVVVALEEGEEQRDHRLDLAVGGKFIKCRYPLNVIKDTYDHSCC